MQNRNNLSNLDSRDSFWIIIEKASIVVLKEASWIILNALPLIIATIIYYALTIEQAMQGVKLDNWLYPDTTFFLFWWYLSLLSRNLKMFGIVLENDLSRISKLSRVLFKLFVSSVFVGTVIHLVLYICVRLKGIDVLEKVSLMDLDDFLWISLGFMLILQIFTYSFQYFLNNMRPLGKSPFKLNINPDTQIKINF